MQRITLHNDLELSRIVHGHWRLAEWGFNDQELLALTEKNLELGITSFDHADIYGNYSCEALFGRALKLKPGLRDNIEIITKCGIKLISDKFSQRKVKHYDYSFSHITKSVEQSLVNLGTDHIDLLLLHRPSPFFDPLEVARAFDHLHGEGKVRFFGVSNFTPRQFEMLQAHSAHKLVTNQLEISPYCLDSFRDGNMELLLKEQVRPMAWSPLAGGRIFNPQDDRGKRLLSTLQGIAAELETSVDQLIYSWILKHPAGIVPIVGSGKIQRIEQAVQALDIKLSLEQWFEIFESSLGHPLP